MNGGDDRITALEERLRRYPSERYPVQHATGRFHLGLALADAGRADEAEASLEAAARGFEAVGLELEHAKALNALGAARRLSGRRDEARTAFADAAAAFGRQGRELEEGAARFNLGLVCRELGDADGARAAFARARALLDPERVPAQAAAAARELGTLLVETGDDAAIELLEEAVALAERGNDVAGRGAAANTLGLARLAAGDTGAAVVALRTAVASHPRSVRPAEYAMTKANLALALEQTGDAERARLTALQAVAVPAAPPPVRRQAEKILARLGKQPPALAALVGAEPPEGRTSLLRDEIARWCDLDDAALGAEADAWVAGVGGRDDRADLWADLAAILLELPPDELERVVRALAREEIADDVRSAALRFHGPQADRLQAVFDRAAQSRWSSPAT